MENYKFTDEDIRRIADVLLSQGTNINELPSTTDTTGVLSLPAVKGGKLVSVDLAALLAALKAATTEAQSATSAALKAKADTVAATAEASNAAEGANAVISEHAAVAVKALLGASAFFDDIIEDATIQPANPTNETGGLVVYVRAKKQFAFKLLQGAITNYYANWSNDTLYHEHDSFDIAKNKIYVNADGLFVWNEQLQDLKKVSTEAVVQLVQEISDDATKAPSAAAVNNAITLINQNLNEKVDKKTLSTVNGQLLTGGKNIVIEGGKSNFEKDVVLVTGNLIKEVEFGKLILDNGNIQTNTNYAYCKFVSVAGMASIKISTSWSGQTKGCFYKTKDVASKVESINLGSGAVFEKEVPVPEGAFFVQISFSREDLVNGTALIKEVGNTNEEGVLPRVKSFSPLKVSRIIENQFMNKNGGMSEYTGLHTYIYNVENLESVFLDGGSDLQPKVSYVQVKDSSGKVLWRFDHSSTNKFKRFHLWLPEGSVELWVLFTIDVLLAKEQGDINKEFTKQLESVKEENATIKKSVALTDNNVETLKVRVKTLEDKTTPTPTPTPTPTTTNSLNHWKGKKIVWLGSSVPAGQTSESNPDLIIPDDGGEVHFLKRPYPTQIAEKLECTVINNCHSGMAVVANKVAEGVYHPLKYGSFCLSKAEYKAVNQERSGKYTYEDSLISPECRDADLYVLEFEINNLGLDKGKTAYESIIPKFNFGSWRYADGSSFESHRETYQGAILFLLNKLFEFNPTAKIVFVNEFFSASASKWGAEFMPQTLTRQLAEKLNAPYIELSKILQYNAVNRWKYMFSENDMHIRAAVHDRIANILAHKFLEIA